MWSVCNSLATFNEQIVPMVKSKDLDGLSPSIYFDRLKKLGEEAGFFEQEFVFSLSLLQGIPLRVVVLQELFTLMLAKSFKYFVFATCGSLTSVWHEVENSCQSQSLRVFLFDALTKVAPICVFWEFKLNKIMVEAVKLEVDIMRQLELLVLNNDFSLIVQVHYAINELSHSKILALTEEHSVVLDDSFFDFRW